MLVAAIVIGGVAFCAALLWFTIFWMPDALDRRRDRAALAKDEGAAIYERLIELLETRQSEWQNKTFGCWDLTSAHIRIDASRYNSANLIIGGTRLTPGSAWQKRIYRAVEAMREDRARAAALHAICDAIETMAASNVIPMKRAGNDK